MKKAKRYSQVRLVPEAIQEFENYVLSNKLIKSTSSYTFKIDLEDQETWYFDTFDEFLAEYPRAVGARYNRYEEGFDLEIAFVSGTKSLLTTVEVKAESREIIQKLFNIVEKYRERSFIPLSHESQSDRDLSPVVFIGHGRSQQWRDLKDHLHEKHGYEVMAYEIGAREGHTIRDILEDMLDQSSMAF